MDKYVVLYNPYSCSNTGKEKAKKLKKVMKRAKLKFVDVTKIHDCQKYVDKLGRRTRIVVCGGDGTLNHFINSVDTDKMKNDVYCYSAGSGNDFLRDIGKLKSKKPVLITKYLKHLPVATVKGKKYKFLNNISYGIDGYCCEVADELRKKSDKPVNYSLIAIKGLLGGYSPKNATVEVDGKKMYFEKAWLAPSLNGRYIGGGLKIAPTQKRLNKDHTVTFVVMYNLKSRLKCMLNFPRLIVGKYDGLDDIFKSVEGHKISVSFDKPAAVQIDGETILNVSHYDVETR